MITSFNLYYSSSRELQNVGVRYSLKIAFMDYPLCIEMPAQITVNVISRDIDHIGKGG